MTSDRETLRDEFARLLTQIDGLEDAMKGQAEQFKGVRAGHAEEACRAAKEARLTAENREPKEMIFGSVLPGESAWITKGIISR